MSNQNNYCSLHKQSELKFYCETCEDAVCQICTKQQPHSGFYHKIITLEDAKQQRLNHYHQYVKQCVNPIRKKLTQKLVEFKQIQLSIKFITDSIHKDINVEFLNIEQNLKGKQSILISQIQTNIKHNQNYINNLDDLCYSFQNTVEIPQKFLMLYQRFDEQLKYLQSINIDGKVVDVSVTLPRQIAFAYNKVKSIKEYEKRNNLMNLLLEKAIVRFNTASAQKRKEIQLWEKRILGIFNQVNYNLTSLNQVKKCAFCELPFRLSTANEACSANIRFKGKVQPKQDIPYEAKGTKRHYWVESGQQRCVKPSLNVHSVIRQSQKALYESALKNVKTIKYQLEKYFNENSTNIQKLFSADDKNKDGYVTRIAFIFILTKKVQISSVHANILANSLTTQKGINYRQLMNFINEPQKIYQQFLKQQQQAEKNRPIAPLTRPKYMY